MSLMTNYRVSTFCMFMQDPRECTEQLHEIWGTSNTPSPHTSATSSTTPTAPTTYRNFLPSESTLSSPSTNTDSQSRHESISDRVSRAWRSIRIRTRSSFASRPKDF